MRATVAVLLIVAGVGNAAYLGIPAISHVSFTPVRAADWEWYQRSATSEKLKAGGAALLWSSTITSMAMLPWLKEPARRKWYLPIACAALGGGALYLAGRVMESRQEP